MKTPKADSLFLRSPVVGVVGMFPDISDKIEINYNIDTLDNAIFHTFSIIPGRAEFGI